MKLSTAKAIGRLVEKQLSTKETKKIMQIYKCEVYGRLPFTKELIAREIMALSENEKKYSAKTTSTEIHYYILGAVFPAPLARDIFNEIRTEIINLLNK